MTTLPAISQIVTIPSGLLAIVLDVSVSLPGKPIITVAYYNTGWLVAEARLSEITPATLEQKKAARFTSHLEAFAAGWNASERLAR